MTEEVQRRRHTYINDTEANIFTGERCIGPGQEISMFAEDAAKFEGLKRPQDIKKKNA